MQPEFRNRLSADVRTLVQQTEDSAGIEITVVVDPERASGSPDEPDPMACEVDEHGAQLLLGDAAYFPDPSVFHELQHIRRVLLEGVPRVVVCEDFEPWSPQLDTAVAQLDNNIEHLIIVPRELEAYPVRRGYWEARVRRMLDRLAGNELPGIDRERFAMLAWVLVHHMTPRQELQDAARCILRELRIEERAGQSRDAVMAALESKEQLVRITFEYFALPATAGCLKYLDAGNGTASVVSLPDVLA